MYGFFVAFIAVFFFFLPSLSDRENQDLAPTMNTVAVHSRMVDSFDEVMIEYADMSFLW